VTAGLPVAAWNRSCGNVDGIRMLETLARPCGSPWSNHHGAINSPHHCRLTRQKRNRAPPICMAVAVGCQADEMEHCVSSAADIALQHCVGLPMTLTAPMTSDPQRHHYRTPRMRNISNGSGRCLSQTRKPIRMRIRRLEWEIPGNASGFPDLHIGKYRANVFLCFALCHLLTLL
jgi:hypothetical protein